MATNSYHPGIYCKSQSTKNTASIVLDSQLISLSKSYQKQTPIESKKDTNIENKHDNEQEDIAHFFHPQNYSFSSIERHKKRNVSTGSIAATMCSLELLPNMDELNNYHKHKQLGTGTDAHVYEVIDCRDKTHVAMKLTKRKSGRYRTEIHLLHQLRTCPYIVKLLKVLEDPNVYVLILEQAPMTLETLLHERCVENPMQEGVAKDIMLNLLKGIRAIHNLGFVHKDIKPENVLIFADRIHRKLLAKIADFGFATRAKPPIDINNNKINIPKQILNEFIERVGDKCGTPGFWCPELVANCVQLEDAFKMDVFSTGVCLYLERAFGVENQPIISRSDKYQQHSHSDILHSVNLTDSSWNVIEDLSCEFV
eukprot:294712_1